jgi:hypothetical protein
VLAFLPDDQNREIFRHSRFIEAQVDTTFIERNWQSKAAEERPRTCCGPPSWT